VIVIRLLTFCVLAIVVGVGVGVGFARFGVKGPHRLGPFADQSESGKIDIEGILNKMEPAPGTPRAEVVGTKAHDFGTSKRGAAGEHKFVVRNVGDGPMELKVLSATCKCTVGNLEKNVLQPGEETAVKLSWEIKTDAPVFSQSATIQTTDPENLEIVFTITGSIVDDVMFDPGSWNISQIEPQLEQELVSTIYLYKSEPFQLIEAGWTREQISKFSKHSFTERPLDLEKDTKHSRADRAIDLKIKLLPGLRQGPLSEIFRVRYFVGEGTPPPPEMCPVADLSLSGTVAGDISIIGGPKLEINNQMFLYHLGKSSVGKELTAKVFVNIRGESAKGELPKIMKIYPEVVHAELGQPVEREKSILIPLSFGLGANTPPIELSGRDRNDYGWIEIGFDDNKRAPVKLFIEFMISETE
jgi:hypothetical protein